MASRKEDPVPQVIDMPVDDEQPPPRRKQRRRRAPSGAPRSSTSYASPAAKDDRYDFAISEQLHAER